MVPGQLSTNRNIQSRNGKSKAPPAPHPQTLTIHPHYDINNPPDADLTNLESKTQSPTVRPYGSSIVEQLQRIDQNYRPEYQVLDKAPSGNAGSR